MADPMGVVREIIVEREGEPTIRGHYWVWENLVTVRSEDGRQKTTQVGNSPPHTIARLLLRELEGARLAKDAD